jgi:cystathionine gamma-synthase
VLKYLKTPEDHTTFIFTSQASAAECIEFAINGPRRDDENLPAIPDGPETQGVTREELSLRVLEIAKTGQSLYAIIFPLTEVPKILPFWVNAGTGIPSRLAEECLLYIPTLREIPADSLPTTMKASAAHFEIKNRIVSLLERSTVGGPRSVKVTEDDIYLFQSGMAAIYQTHKYLLASNANTQKTAFFGFAFHSTLHVFSDFGPGYKLFARGTDNELASLTEFLQAEKAEGTKVQAIWAEFPSNPSLTVPNLVRLRNIADEYGCLLIIDDTIGSFANVDLMGAKGVDVLVTSLTKSFSGYADVMGASVVLNPLGSRFEELKDLFSKCYALDYCELDAAVMASNSRDYLQRSKVLNTNTQSLVDFFQTKSLDPSTSIKSVFHPTTNPAFLANFDRVKRPTTADFNPGYGCLFSIEFETLEKLEVFYDNLNMHMGPHLGAHRTIVIPYVKVLYGKELEWATKCGLKETSEFLPFSIFFVQCEGANF